MERRLFIRVHYGYCRYHTGHHIGDGYRSVRHLCSIVSFGNTYRYFFCSIVHHWSYHYLCWFSADLFCFTGAGSFVLYLDNAL